MIARGAQINPSAFRKEGLVPFDEVAKEYLKVVSQTRVNPTLS
jgi:tRNA-dihydrouridine synthase 2